MEEANSTTRVETQIGTSELAVKTRCPQCDKLYIVDTQHLNDDVAVFRCRHCSSSFFFAVDQVLNQQVESILVDIPTFRMPELEFVDPARPEVLKSARAVSESAATKENKQQDIQSTVAPPPTVATQLCPKCQSVNLPSAKDCVSCGINFVKFQIMKSDGPSLRRIHPVLHSQWQTVIENYEEPRHHDRFVELCVDKQQLPLAARCYERIIAADPADEIARQRRTQVQGLAAIPLELARAQLEPAQVPLWRRYSFAIVYTVSGILVTLGFAIPTYRNLVGMGVALLMVSLGVQFWLRSDQ